jgi:beta-lactamase class A
LNGEELESLLAACDLTEASAVVWPLDGGGPVSVRAEANLYPASMIKLPIAVALERLAAAGRVSLDARTSVRPESVTVNDAPSPFVAGYETSLRACAEAMLSLSDNVATNALIDALGRDVITRECEALGLRGTAVRRKLSGALPLIADPAATGRNAHPAADCARLLARIADDVRPGGNWIYDALLAQFWNDKLPRGWNPEDTFAHKTGDTDDASHDGGILTLPGGRRYVVVVYTPLASCAATDEKLAGFARRLRPLL